MIKDQDKKENIGRKSSNRGPSPSPSWHTVYYRIYFQSGCASLSQARKDWKVSHGRTMSRY